MPFIHPNRWIEHPNTRNSIGNGFPLKKYVGAVVRKSSQLIMDEEIDHSENNIPVQKSVTFHSKKSLKKNIFKKKVSLETSKIFKILLAGRQKSRFP